MSRTTLFIISVLLVLGAVSAQNDNYCRAVALQGGGDRGTYEAGVLYGFVMNGNASDFTYDVMTGVSAGSINTLAMMIFPKGREVNMVEFLTNSWLAGSADDIFHPWPGSYLEGLFFKPSLVDNDPELNYLRSQIYAPPIQRKAVIVTTDVNTASKVIFTEQDWINDQAEDYIFAAHTALFSSAIPAFFKYRVYPPFSFIDGGWSESIDIEDAILRCEELGFEHNQIILDVIYCANATLRIDNANKMSAMQMYIRGQELNSWRKNTFLFTFTKESFPKINWRYLAIPTHILPDENFPMDFKKANMEYMINIGIQDAQEIMAQGAGVSVERAYNSFKQYQNGLSKNSRNPYSI